MTHPLPTPDGRPQTWFEGLDALRGLAAIFVIWLHSSEMFVKIPAVAAHGTVLYDVINLAGLGRAGLIGFFAVSGFVICATLRGPLGTTLASFAIKRFFRLYPVFWVSIPFGLWAAWYLFDKPISWQLIAANITILPMLLGQPVIMGQYWSLETEALFYVLAAAMFAVGILWKGRWVLAVIAIFQLVLALGVFHLIPYPEYKPWQITPYHMGIVLWGWVARMAHDRNQAAGGAYWNWIKDREFLVASALMLGPALARLALWESQTSISAAIAGPLGMAMFVGFLVFPYRYTRNAVWRFLVWVGTVSYSTYLFHPVVFYPLYWWARQHPESWVAQLHVSAYVLFAVAGTLVVAGLSFRWFEDPPNQYAHRLVKRLFPASRTSAKAKAAAG